jgi:hypothetical protein
MLDQLKSPAAAAALNLRSTVSAAVLDEGAVLLDLESKYFYALNASAWAITQLFETGASLEQVAERARGWGAPSDDEVTAFVERLREYQLLEDASFPLGETQVEWKTAWHAPTIERQAEPLQNVMVSAFDPSIPLAE